MCLGDVYQAAEARKRLLGAAEAGITWLLRRCPIIEKIDFYLTCPEENEVNNNNNNYYYYYHHRHGNRMNSIVCNWHYILIKV